MAGYWSVVLPETNAVTNMVNRPSVETTDMTGYNCTAGATIEISSDKSRRGYQSLKDQPSTNTNCGMYFDSIALTVGTAYAFSFDFWGTSAIPYKAYFADTAGTAQTAAATTFSASGQWQRISHLYTSTATANFRLYITKNNNVSSDLFYVDGFQATATAYDVDYIDGDQEDGVWNGSPHLSTSYREAGSRAGGRVYNLDNYQFYLSEWPGVGMPDITPLTSALALLPGSMDQGEKEEERTFDLIGEIIGTSFTNLHYSRQQLINAIKSNAVKDKQQFSLVYSGANSDRPLRSKARYIGGLTWNKSVENGYAEKLALRCLATDPYWYEDGQEGTALTVSASDSDATYAIKRVNGVWSTVNSGFTEPVKDIAKGPDGKMYYGGLFDSLGSTDGSAIISFADKDSTAPIALGAGGSTTDVVSAIAIAPNGDLYAGGLFANMKGVANTLNIARWDGTNWNAMGTGSTNTIGSLAFGNDGTLYAGKNYLVGSDTNGDQIAKWSAGAWSALGSGILGENSVSSIAVHPNGDIYATGDFVTAGGVTCNGIARWDGAAWNACGSGFNVSTGGAGYCIAIDKSGNVYVGGTFTTAGGVTCNGIAKWNGSKWEQLGSGAASTGTPGVYGLVMDEDGLLYAGGSFDSIGGLTVADGMAIWNGTSWAHLPIKVTGLFPRAIYTYNNNLFIGLDTPGTLYSSAITTVTNTGTANAYPVITIKRTDATSTDTATVEYLKNETSGATLWLDHALQCGETLTLDFRPKQRNVISSFYGNISGRALLRNSDFAAFCLLPGANSVSLFVNTSGAAAATAYEVHQIAHLSIDGSSTG